MPYKNTKNGRWVTIRGRRVFISTGQTLSDAMRASTYLRDKQIYVPKGCCVDTSDEDIPRSLSATAKNYDILLPNGKIAHLVEGTRIVNKQIFAGAGTKTPIKDESRLVRQYGGIPGHWVKVKGLATISVEGKDEQVELHWYEEPSVGKVDLKVKRTY